MKISWNVEHGGDRGASAVEYALLIALVAAIVVGGVIALGELLPTLYDAALSKNE